MISNDYGYVIVDERDAILLCSLAPNRHACWQRFLKEWKAIGRTKKEYQKMGFKCVRVDLQTEEYKRR
jgi:hypothetical protein